MMRKRIRRYLDAIDRSVYEHKRTWDRCMLIVTVVTFIVGFYFWPDLTDEEVFRLIKFY